MKKLNWLFLVLFLFIPLRAGADEPIELRVANYLPPMSVAISKVMEPWLSGLEEKAGKRLHMRRFWGGSLGRGPYRQYLLVEKGVADIAYLFLPMHAGRFPDTEVLEMPLMFDTAEEASIAGWQLFEEGLMRGFEEVKVLGIFTTAPGRLFTRHQIKNLSGYESLKFRAAGQLQAAYVTALGATPEIIDAVSATEALRRGTIDGLIQGWSGMAIFRQTDVTDYFFDVPVGMLPFAVVMNKEKWQSLPLDVQELIMSRSGAVLSRQAGQAYDKAANGFRQRFVTQKTLTREPIEANERAVLESKVAVIAEQWAAQDEGHSRILRRVREIRRVEALNE